MLFQQYTPTFLGLQANINFKNYSVIKPYVDTNFWVNEGDPFISSEYPLNVKWMECNVLDYYASL